MAVTKEFLLKVLSESKLDPDIGIAWFDKKKVEKLHHIYEIIGKDSINYNIDFRLMHNNGTEISFYISDFVKILYEAGTGNKKIVETSINPNKRNAHIKVNSEEFLQSLNSEYAIKSFNDAIDRMIEKLRTFRLFTEDIRNFYKDKLSLKPETITMMEDGKLSYQTFQDAARINPTQFAKRVFDLDTYAGEGDVEVGNPGLYVTLFIKYHANGVFLIYNGKDIGYSLLYPVVREYDENIKQQSGILEGRERVQWPKLVKYIQEALYEGITINNIWHLYDYAIKSIPLEDLNDGKDDPYRKQGLGRLVLRLGYDICLGPDDLSIGFIDDTKAEKHMYSLIAATACGGFLGKQVEVSHDGPHSSILCMFSKNQHLYLNKNGNGLIQRNKIVDSANEIKGATGNHGHFVGFDFAKNMFGVLKGKN